MGASRSAAAETSMSAPLSSPLGLPASPFCWLRHADNVAGGRSFVRQNSLTLWPLFSYRASQSAFSAAVQFTLVLGFAADWVATVNAFVTAQVLLDENLRCHISADQFPGHSVRAVRLSLRFPKNFMFSFIVVVVVGAGEALYDAVRRIRRPSGQRLELYLAVQTA